MIHLCCGIRPLPRLLTHHPSFTFPFDQTHANILYDMLTCDHHIGIYRVLGYGTLPEHHSAFRRTVMPFEFAISGETDGRGSINDACHAHDS
jgi:hypothetical protein